jgi:hypothetical protein
MALQLCKDIERRERRVWALGDLCEYINDDPRDEDGHEYITEWEHAARDLLECVHDAVNDFCVYRLGQTPARVVYEAVEWYSRGYILAEDLAIADNVLSAIIDDVLDLHCCPVTRLVLLSHMLADAHEGIRRSLESNPDVRMLDAADNLSWHVDSMASVLHQLEQTQNGTAFVLPAPVGPQTPPGSLPPFVTQTPAPVNPEIAREVPVIKGMLSAVETLPSSSDARVRATADTLAYSIARLHLFLAVPRYHNFVATLLTKFVELWKDRERFTQLDGCPTLDNLLAHAINAVAPNAPHTADMWVLSLAVTLESHVSVTAPGRRDVLVGFVQMVRDAADHMEKMQPTLAELEGRHTRGSVAPRFALGEAAQHFGLARVFMDETHDIVVSDDPLPFVETWEDDCGCGPFLSIAEDPDTAYEFYFARDTVDEDEDDRDWRERVAEAHAEAFYDGTIG